MAQLILYLGLTLFIGYFLSLILHQLGIPNVLVYIIVGFLVGNLLLGDMRHTEGYDYIWIFIETIALGLIGFKIGTEMDISLLKRASREITILTLSQVIITFVLVFVGVFIFTKQFVFALILGGLATATAPAATIEIIRKFQAEGPLTTKLQWVLAFDDVLAVLIVEGIIAYASIALVGKIVTFGGYFLNVGQEIVLAIVLGLIVGFILDLIIEQIHLDQKLEMMEISLGALIFVMGLALYLHTSVILASMTVGALTVNREGDNYRESSELLEVIMSPIIVVFFVMVGAKLTFSSFNPFPWLAVIYFVSRFIGKVYGTNWGASVADSEPVVQQNLGLGMLPQGGVALGLMVVASDLYVTSGDEISAALLVVTIVVSTVFSEGIGSFTAMFGLRRAGELKPDKIKDNPILEKALEGNEAPNHQQVSGNSD